MTTINRDTSWATEQDGKQAVLQAIQGNHRLEIQLVNWDEVIFTCACGFDPEEDWGTWVAHVESVTR